MAARASISELTRYRWTNRILVAALVVYLALAVGREAKMGRSEIYPFASWSLFSKVPNDLRDYSLRLTQIDGRPLESPLYFEDAGKYLRSVGSNGAWMSIQELGLAVQRGDAAGTASVRRYLEPLFLGGHEPVAYEVVIRTYDPLERWRTGRFKEERSIREFRFDSAKSAEVAHEE